jgi:nitroimidazol reductase NimA-like FMN-containing flavoprotein (pyridoxamine 5'-phosphate oxidase superfamily)
MIGTLSDVEMENLLHSQLIGRLACIQGDEPYIVPMAFAYEGSQILCQTTPGLKLATLRLHPKVCFEVDQLTDLRNWKSVILFGTFREIQELQMSPSRQWLFDRIFPMSTPAETYGYGHAADAVISDENRLKPVLFAIDIHRMTGRFEKQ